MKSLILTIFMMFVFTGFSAIEDFNYIAGQPVRYAFNNYQVNLVEDERSNIYLIEDKWSSSTSKDGVEGFYFKRMVYIFENGIKATISTKILSGTRELSMGDIRKRDIKTLSYSDYLRKGEKLDMQSYSPKNKGSHLVKTNKRIYSLNQYVSECRKLLFKVEPKIDKRGRAFFKVSDKVDKEILYKFMKNHFTLVKYINY